MQFKSFLNRFWVSVKKLFYLSQVDKKEIKRIPKDINRMLRDLEFHLYSLTKNLKEMEKDEEYYKIVATELRLLICKTRSNKPLLLNLMKKFNKSKDYYLTINNELKKENYKINILDYPKIKAGFFYKDKDYINDEMIKIIASQDGSAHEDESLDEGIAFNEKVIIGGIKPNIFFLKRIGKNIKNIGFDFLKKLESEGKYKFKRKIINSL